MAVKKAPKVDKVIVTNVKALRAKYGAGGVATIRQAVRRLIAADKGRGLSAALVDLSSAAAMARSGGKAVTVPTDPRQNKQAVDAVYRVFSPSYLMILGSIDVVPHQDLANPVYSPTGDPDPLAYGDLPYACNRPYTRNIAQFTGPTRVVGRLPDVTGGNDPLYLAGLLDTAANYKPQPPASYLNYLGISAAMWVGSTTMSLQNVFGSAAALQLAPPSGPAWTAGQFASLSHFINCHGAPADPHFYGQDGVNYPIAHDAPTVAACAVEGTVVAAECCYGAELYAPTAALGQAGICNTYLERKSYGFLGSSTIAYGPAAGNADADLICQYFFNHLLAGSLMGVAVLQARQDFIKNSGVLGPVELKTLAQFNLMSDPSLAPVTVTPVDHIVGKSRTPRALSTAMALADPAAGFVLRRASWSRQGRQSAPRRARSGSSPRPGPLRAFRRSSRRSPSGLAARRRTSSASTWTGQQPLQVPWPSGPSRRHWDRSPSARSTLPCPDSQAVSKERPAPLHLGYSSLSPASKTGT